MRPLLGGFDNTGNNSFVHRLEKKHTRIPIQADQTTEEQGVIMTTQIR
jgi:hypothetical protein